MGGQKKILIYFQKLHEMARKLNENFFGPPLHPKNSHFLSKILWVLKYSTFNFHQGHLALKCGKICFLNTHNIGGENGPKSGVLGAPTDLN